MGSRVRFLLIVFKANLKASSSAPEGPLSMDSNIPPEGETYNKRNTMTNKYHHKPTSVIAICTLPCRYGHCLVDVAVSLSCLCNTVRYIFPLVKELAFLVHSLE